jgi:hypothetical protein
MKLLYVSLFVVFFGIILSSCKDDNSTNNSKSGTFYSASVTLGAGTAKSFVKLDDNGNPVSVGLVLSEQSMQSLGSSTSETIVQLPSQATATNLNHIAIDWNPMGHEPAHIYDIPHFDFHFYMVDMAFRNNITAMGADTLKTNKQPATGFLAPDYILPPGGVPMMGNHAIDMTSPEFHDATFTQTYIYGYYDANMIFYEPMITRDYILSKAGFTRTLKVPAKYPKAGYYPTTLDLKFDAATNEYIMTLGTMVKFAG